MIVLIHNLRPGLKEMHSRRLVYEVVIFIATKHGYCFYEDKNQKPEMIIRILFAVRSSRTPNRRQTRHNHRSKISGLLIGVTACSGVTFLTMHAATSASCVETCGTRIYCTRLQVYRFFVRL